MGGEGEEEEGERKHERHGVCRGLRTTVWGWVGPFPPSGYEFQGHSDHECRTSDFTFCATGMACSGCHCFPVFNHLFKR